MIAIRLEEEEAMVAWHWLVRGFAVLVRAHPARPSEAPGDDAPRSHACGPRAMAGAGDGVRVWRLGLV